MESLSIHEFKRMNLKGATVIDGFPSVGLVSSIVANYLVNTLELEQIGILDSVYFPSVALVRKAEPMNSVRLYASERVHTEAGMDQLVVFVSEFQPPSNLVKIIAKTMLDWAQEQKCKRLICPEGLIIEKESTGGIGAAEQQMGGGGEEEEEGEAQQPSIANIPPLDPNREIALYGIASSLEARKKLEEMGVELFQEGVITGVAGVLLNEGKVRDFEVLSFLAEAHPNIPDARAAAKVIEAINKVVPLINVDPKPLYMEAEAIEAQLRSLHKQTKVIKQIPSPHMYG